MSAFENRGIPAGRGCWFRFKEYSGSLQTLSTANFAEKWPVLPYLAYFRESYCAKRVTIPSIVRPARLWPVASLPMIEKASSSPFAVVT